MQIDTLAATVLSSSRKSLLRRRPVFRSYKAVQPDQLREVEGRIGVSLPADLRHWLTQVGYGDIDDELSFREEWLAKIGSGQLKGGTIFAQDIAGSFYAIQVTSGRVYYLSRSRPVFGLMSPGFLEFMEELVRRDYKLGAWTDSLPTQKYEW